MRLACCLVLVLGGLQLASALRVGAWNIRRFGPKKASNPRVMGYISMVVQGYDIILIQELQDTKPGHPVVTELMRLVNKGCEQYNYTVSAPLGPSTYKEQYLFVYKSNSVTVRGSFQYPAGNFNFSRPPFVVSFNDRQVGNFVLIPQHTSPPPNGNVVEQLNGLVRVATAATQQWRTQNMLLLGNFNAGCRYVTQRDWPKILLRAKPFYRWLIPDTADTNVAGTSCPYDRIVATTPMMQHVVANSAQVYNFKTALGLTQQEALDLSYHFLVEVELYSKVCSERSKESDDTL